MRSATTRRPLLPYRLALTGALMGGAALLAAGCASTPVPADTAPAPAEAAQPAFGDWTGDGQGRRFRIDPAQSMVRIYAFRGGLAARAGHNHVFAPRHFEGLALLPPRDASEARFDLRVRLADLAVDDPAWRAETGDAFAGERSVSDIEGTLRNLLGPRGLDAERFPELRLRSLAMHGDWPILVADTAITLHGVTRQQPVMIELRRLADRIEASGTLVIQQTDFGVEPFSVLGGVLAVQDPVAVRFHLVGIPASGD